MSNFNYCPRCGTKLTLEERGHRRRPTCQNCDFVHFRNPAPAVGVFVINKGQILLGKRTENPGLGKWAIPSGYIEYDEDYLNTAIREVKEETGFDISIQSIIKVESVFLSPEHHLLTIYLLGQVVGGELLSGDDLVEVGWYSLEGPLPEMAFIQDIELIKGLLQAR